MTFSVTFILLKSCYIQTILEPPHFAKHVNFFFSPISHSPNSPRDFPYTHIIIRHIYATHISINFFWSFLLLHTFIRNSFKSNILFRAINIITVVQVYTIHKSRNTDLYRLRVGLTHSDLRKPVRAICCVRI